MNSAVYGFWLENKSCPQNLKWDLRRLVMIHFPASHRVLHLTASLAVPELLTIRFIIMFILVVVSKWPKPIKMLIPIKIEKYSVLRGGENRRNFQKCLLCSRAMLSLSLTFGEIYEAQTRVYIFFKQIFHIDFLELFFFSL